MDSKHQTKWLWFWQCGKQASVLLDVQVTLPPPRSGVWDAAIYFFLTRNQEMYCICVHCINLAKPEQRTFNGILHILLIKTKSCRLKPINHERWDLMDFWVNVYYHCKFKVISKKTYIIKIFSHRCIPTRFKRFPVFLGLGQTSDFSWDERT